jgi:hypothetical protein
MSLLTERRKNSGHQAINILLLRSKGAFQFRAKVHLGYTSLSSPA